jgi:hypothetical protein
MAAFLLRLGHQVGEDELLEFGLDAVWDRVVPGVARHLQRRFFARLVGAFPPYLLPARGSHEPALPEGDDVEVCRQVVDRAVPRDQQVPVRGMDLARRVDDFCFVEEFTNGAGDFVRQPPQKAARVLPGDQSSRHR